MDYNSLIGLPLEKVKHKLDQCSIKYIVTQSSDIQKNFDTLLVVKIKQLEQNLVEITTDKFLLDI